jgi:hypothetical protein
LDLLNESVGMNAVSWPMHLHVDDLSRRGDVA